MAALDTPTREELARVFPTTKLQRAFEALFRVSGSTVPDLSGALAAAVQNIAAVDLVAGNAAAQALFALAEIARNREAIEAATLTPPAPFAGEIDRLSELVEVLASAPTSARAAELAQLRAQVEALELAPPVQPVTSTAATLTFANAPALSVNARINRTSADVINYTADALVLGNASNADTIVIKSVNVSPDKTVAAAANGRDSAGAIANNTWAYEFVIADVVTTPGTPIVAGLWSTSATAPTLPGAYTYFARVHQANTTTTGFLPQVGADGKVEYTNQINQPVLVAGTSAAAAAVNCSTYVPPGFTRVRVGAYFIPAAAGNGAYFGYTSGMTFAGDFTGFLFGPVASQGASGDYELPITGQTFYYAISGAGSGTLFLRVGGYN